MTLRGEIQKLRCTNFFTNKNKYLISIYSIKNISYILLISITLLSCVDTNDSSKNNITNHQIKKSSNKIIVKNIIPLDLDTLNFIMAKDTLIKNIITDNELILQQKGLLNLFVNKEVTSISYLYSKKYPPKNKYTLPGKIIKVTFKDIASAKEVFSIFSDELYNSKLNGKIAIKSGGISFINKESIFLIPISTCSNNHKIDFIEKTLTKHLFLKKQIIGIKFYCGFKEVFPL